MRTEFYIVECEDTEKKEKFAYATCRNLEEAEEKLDEAIKVFGKAVYYIEKITFERIEYNEA